MNKVLLLGRLTRDAEIRYSQGENARAVARFSLAVDRRIRKDANDGQPTADFISCVAFGKTAEFLEKYGKKGTKFVTEGRIQTGSYEKDGQKVYTTDVVVDQVEFAESKATNNAASASTATPAATPEAVPDGFMSIPDGIEDELPFF